MKLVKLNNAWLLVAVVAATNFSFPVDLLSDLFVNRLVPEAAGPPVEPIF